MTLDLLQLSEEGTPEMIRIVVTVILMAAAVLAQTALVSPQAPTPPPVAAPGPPKLAGPAELAPDAVVITIHGVCRAGKSPCVTTVTRDQFDTIVSAMTFNTPGQALTAAAMRNFAENYVQSLTVADAAEKAGVDQDPRFQELMNIMRLRILADAYRHSLQEKYSKPSPQEIEAEYMRNVGKFSQVALDRIFIPKFNPKSPRENRAEFEKKAQQLAGEVRDRAARGEDMGKLQAEAYKALGLTPPPTTDIGTRRIASLPPAIEREISALKAGAVSQVGSESAGFTIYKVRNRETLPLEQVKVEIIREIYQKKMDEAIKAVQDRVHADFEPQFFGPKGPPIAPPAAKPVRTP
jgi:PPIC-type PPIASE domain